MRYLFEEDPPAVLRRLARHRTLCAFDFDGTLAPIVSDPSLAGLLPETCVLLEQLASLYPCIVISGRSKRDVSAKLRGLPLCAVIGNHGAEAETEERPNAMIEAWRKRLSSLLGDEQGVWIENKGASLAVHYRSAPQREEAHARIVGAVASLSNVRAFGGKFVVNLTLRNAPDKGTALVAELERLQCKSALYVGDDENDETAFSVGRNVISVRIGHDKHSAAKYYLREQYEINILMKTMILLRHSMMQDANI